ncbi:unnamed protein product [Brachionus calyciflorus]|uniref:Uncharacterized protein n=1 Tax=Brachionus calyciflorus TaxID=104777 RepID=A0A813TV92_9BILA|nr:unnamed protein product [Brachionus calyciflorus]
MNRYSNIQSDNYFYYRSHSVSSKSSSVTSHESDKRKKCSNCSIWLNLTRIFEFFLTGRFDEHIPTELYEPNLSHFFNLTKDLVFLKNPIDPSDIDSFVWDFKSPLFYKLLKLKVKLLNRTEQFIKTFQTNDQICKKCFRDSKYFQISKNFLISKLGDYVNYHKPGLERLLDRYAKQRLKNSFEINNLNDLNLYIREYHHQVYQPLFDFNNNQAAIDLCANKIHSLLDILIYEDFNNYQKRLNYNFNNATSTTNNNSSSGSRNYITTERNSSFNKQPSPKLESQEYNVNYDVDLDLSLLKKEDDVIVNKKRSVSESSISSVTSDDEPKIKKKKKKSKKLKKNKLENNEQQPSVVVTQPAPPAPQPAPSSSSLITEIRKTNDKKKTKIPSLKENLILILVDFNLDLNEMDCLKDLLPIIGHKITNLSLDEYLNDVKIKTQIVKTYLDLIEKYSQSIRLDTGLLREKFLKKYVDENNNLDLSEEEFLNDFESKYKLILRILNEISSRLHKEEVYLEKLNLILTSRKDLDDETATTSSKYDELRKDVHVIQLDLVEYARSKLLIVENNKYDIVNTMSFSYLFDIIERFLSVYDI